MKKYISGILAVCILLGMLFYPCKVNAQDYKFFQLNIASIDDDAISCVDSIFTGDDIFVPLGTNLDMWDVNIDYSDNIDSDDVFCVFKREDNYYYVCLNKVLVLGEDIYVNLEELLNALVIDSFFDANSATLYLKPCQGVGVLENIILDVYSDQLYRLGYWQDSWIYGVDTFVGSLYDMASNISFLSYLNGHKYNEVHMKAITDIMFSVDDEFGDLEFMEDTVAFMKEASDYKKLADNTCYMLGQGRESAFLGDWGEVFEAFAHIEEVANVEELLLTYAYVENIKTSEESNIRALEKILECKNNDDDKTRKVCKEVLKIYKKETPMWQLVVDEYVEEACGEIIENAETEINEALLKHLFGIKIEAIEITKTVLDEALSTQDEVDATLQAQACLDVQKICENYVEKNKKLFLKSFASLDQSSLNCIKDMCDVTVFYLRCAKAAYESLAIDSDLEMKRACCSASNVIDEKIKEIQQFEESDFTYIMDNSISKNGIIQKMCME